MPRSKELFVLLYFSYISIFVLIREVTSHTAKVNGVDLHYEQGGSGKHVVFMLPGAAGEIISNSFKGF